MIRGLRKRKKVRICRNHLSDFYEAIKKGDLALMDKIEHELSEGEKCVACAYVFKTKGTVREALEAFLNGEGLNVAVERQNTRAESELFYWGLRILVFLVLSSSIIFATFIIKRFIFQLPFSFNYIEFTVIGLVALMVFLFADDWFLD